MYVERFGPDDGEGGAYPNAPLYEVFSQPISDPEDRAKVEAAFSLVKRGTTARVRGRFTWFGDRVLLYVPSQDLETGATYDVDQQSAAFSLSVGAKHAFTVVDTVVAELLSPARSATSMPLDAPVVVVFSQPMDKASLGQITFQRSYVDQNAVPFTAAWYGDRALILKPAQAFRRNTAYAVRIAGGKDTSGRALRGPVTFGFTTGPNFAESGVLPLSAAKATPLPGTATAPLSTAARAFSQRLGAAIR